jgi:ATP-dependent Clp protease ATP-binding subunit ClpC
MLHPFAILVSVKGDHHEVTVPFVDARRFVGSSASTLYDDVALALMQRVVDEQHAKLPAYLYCPDTSLRRVRVSVKFQDEQRWEGRLSVVLRRWPGEDYLECTVPRLGLERFVVDRASSLEAAVARWLRDRARSDATSLIAALELAACRSEEHLDFLEVDLEMPTVLPRTVRKKKRRPRKDEAPTEAERAQRRREVPPTTLREVGTNLVNRVLDGQIPRVIGREALIESLARRIARPGAAILLVGPSGVGKSALIEAVIAKLTSEESRLHARMDAWRVDANRLISGMSMVGQWEGRCESMVEELHARGDLLVVDDLPSLVWAGRTRHEDTNVADFLEPHIAQGELRVLAECTPERLEAARDRAPSFFASFQVVWLPPLDEPTSLRVLVQRARELERAGMARGETVRVDPSVPASVLALTRRFAAAQCLPGRAVRLLEQLATEASTSRRDEDGRRVLDREALVELYAAQTGLPRFVLWEEDGRTREAAREHFARRIVAQPAASDALAELVTTLQQGLNDPHKPIASMLLVGPTGVGKTETAKALAEYLFGSAERLVRFDMSEMQDPYSATRLFGDALRPDGELTRRIRQQPFAVVLLDEIEKAHPAVFDALLALLGEGRLTSADGRTTDFCNTVVLMTSNLGVRDADGAVGFAEGEVPDRSAHYVAAVRAFFRPELFNRIDRILAYRALGRDAVRPLAERAILELMGRRGLRRAGVLVEVEEALIDVLVTRGFDPRYGARALRRVIEQELAVPLARRLVAAPTEATTWVSLYRSGDGVGIDVWPLVEPERAAVEAEPRVEDYATLRAMHAEVCAWMEASRAITEHVRDVSSALLVRYSRGELGEADWPRFTLASELVTELDALEAELTRLEEEELAQHHFETKLEHELSGFDRYGDRVVVQVVPTETVTRLPSPRPPIPLVRGVDALRLGAAEVLHRAEGVDEAPSEALVRVLPGTREPRSHALVADLAQAFLASWGGTGDVRVLVREGGAWRLLEELFDPSEQVRAEGLAIFVRAIRARALVEDELGMHLDLRYEGPDLVAGLARVDEVGLEGEEPATRLTSLDREHDAFLEARRRGADVVSPRGPLPVRRRFEQGVAVDHATGLTVRRDDLTTGLRLVARHRLARLYQERVRASG